MSNTVVVASDHRYIWGVYLLIASMRRSGMEEPVIVLATGYTEPDCAALASLGKVTVAAADPSRRSLTCSKPDAMLLADTEYLSWVDCDGFFIGNCSARLTPPTPDEIRVRRRSRSENRQVFRQFPGDGAIPNPVLEIWRRDVGERPGPRLETCVSACYLSLHRRWRPFLERWRDQMLKVLPEGDVGVVDHRLVAYFQTDESVLNSLLCFAAEAPRVSAEFGLNRDPEALYIHFISRPKPWQCWTPRAFRYFREYTALVDWAQKTGKLLPGPVPLSLRSDRYWTNWLWCHLADPVRKTRNFLRRGFRR